MSSQHSSQPPKQGPLERIVLVTLLLVHAAILLDSSTRNFVTVDETGHIASGIAHWKTGRFGHYCVNPPLPRMLAVLPLLIDHPDCTSLFPVDQPGFRVEFHQGEQFASRNSITYMTMVRLARLAGIVWSWVGAYLIYHWSRAFFGRVGAFLALMIWCIEPNILAHASLVTPDIPATVAGLGATYAFWHFVNKPSWFLACLVGLLLGIAQLTKFTLLVFYVVWPVLWLLHRLMAKETTTWKSARILTLQAICITLLSVVVINAGYGFSGSCCRLGQIPFVSRTFSGGGPGSWDMDQGRAGNRFGGTWLGELIVPLPVDYLRGIDLQRCDFESGQHQSYLNGEWRFPGWWYWYLYALAVKVPAGVWCLVIWASGLALWCEHASSHWQKNVYLWVSALGILGFVSSQSGLTIHLRYVLPIFPFVIISIASLGWLSKSKGFKFAILPWAMLLWAGISSASIHPHYLSYFNGLTGGPDLGYQHLVDSNLDWGQDLLFLKKWLDRHPDARPLQLAYFNLIDPRIVGIEFELPAFGPTGPLPDDYKRKEELAPRPGYHAVSVNYLMGHGLVGAPDGKGHRVHVPPHSLGYFRQFQPIAKAGYSIFIYHISVDEANEVRQKLGLPLLTEETATEEKSHAR